MKSTTVLLLSLLLAGSSSLLAVESVRERISINDDWRFQKDDPAEVGGSLDYTNIREWVLPSSAAFLKNPTVLPKRPGGNLAAKVPFTQPDFDDSAWRKLDLPHDWAIEGPFNQDYKGKTGKLKYWGPVWYRKHLTLPASDLGRRIYLDIDGAMSYASVWCNGQFVGGWPYGYSSFRLDLTPYAKPGSDNVLSIRLDNPDSGPGEIVATDNGDATSHASFQSPNIKAYNGLALAIIRATGPGKITVNARAEGLTEATLVIKER